MTDQTHTHKSNFPFEGEVYLSDFKICFNIFLLAQVNTVFVLQDIRIRNRQMISSRINAIATTKINNSVNTFPPYVILICSAIFHVALKILYHKEK